MCQPRHVLAHIPLLSPAAQAQAGPGFLPDRLDVNELAKPVIAQLAPITRVLDATARQAGIGGHHSVDEGQAGLDLIDKLLLLRWVLAPEARTQAVTAVIGT